MSRLRRTRGEVWELLTLAFLAIATYSLWKGDPDGMLLAALSAIACALIAVRHSR